MQSGLDRNHDHQAGIIWLFVRGDTIAIGERKILSSWSPKGAVSMALAVHAPTLLEEMFEIDMTEIVPLQTYHLMANTVCGAVILSMLVKSLMIPRLYAQVTSQPSLTSEGDL